MKVVLAILGAVVIGGVVWAIVVFSGSDENGGPAPQQLTPEEVQVLAMNQIQQTLALQMRSYVETGSFEEGPEGGSVEVEVCDEGKALLLSRTAADGTPFVLTVRGEEPHSAGEAVFGHHNAEVPCGTEGGPEAWPGGYRVSRQGLMEGDRLAEIPLA